MANQTLARIKARNAKALTRLVGKPAPAPTFDAKPASDKAGR